MFPTAFYPLKCASLAPSTTPLALKKTSVVLWATAVGIIFAKESKEDHSLEIPSFVPSTLVERKHLTRKRTG